MHVESKPTSVDREPKANKHHYLEPPDFDLEFSVSGIRRLNAYYQQSVKPQTVAPATTDLIEAYLYTVAPYPLLRDRTEATLFTWRDTARQVMDDEGTRTPHQRAASDVHSTLNTMILKSNLRLVPGVAKNYPTRTTKLEDHIQNGNMGLMHAINLFDVAKGFKLSTYSRFWIRQSISRNIQGDGFKQSRKERDGLILRRMNDIRADADRLGITFTEQEYADLLDLDVSSVREALSRPRVACSLDEPMPGTDLTRHESIGDDDAGYAAIDDDISAEQLYARLGASLMPHQLIILKRQMECGGERGSQKRIAEELDMTPTALHRQMQNIRARLQRKVPDLTVDGYSETS